MEIPKKFRIAGHEYVVKSNNIVSVDGDSVFGANDVVRCEVLLAKTVATSEGEVAVSECQTENTFWHEVFHTFNYYWNTERDEALAQTFANFMCEFLHSKE